MKLRHYDAIQICLLLLLLLLFYPGRLLNSQVMKRIGYAIQKKYKNQAGMNLTPAAPPSQNSHAVRWHCTAESERESLK